MIASVPMTERRWRPLRTVFVTMASVAAMALPAAANAATCGTLAKMALPGATVTAAQEVAAGQYKLPEGGGMARLVSQPGMDVAGHSAMPSNPAFCRIAATLRPSSDSNIKIEVWMPLTGWNGKFLGAGNFGWAGSLMISSMLGGLADGYATASTDTGHDSSKPEENGGRFALGHPEKLIDYAYRADHLMTVDAKAIIKAFYGKAAVKSYFIGCSLGGLEGLIEAKRYPTDYDGIVVGAPPNPIVNFNAEQLWPGWLGAHDPKMVMSKDKFTMVHTAMMKACATPIGQQQGFIEEPNRCGLAPKDLLCKGANAPDCLTATEVVLLDKLYQGPISPTTGKVIFPGPAKGSEGSMSADGKPFPVALDMFKYPAFENPDWDWSTLDWGKDVDAATAKVGPLMHVDNDLRPFFAHGGKMIFYIGWNDGHNPAELMGYYDAVARTSGAKLAGAMRLFAIPGMNHCFGGMGCDTFSKLGVIDAWVVHGQAPQRIDAARVMNGQVVRTRPICAYPLVAKYKGTGDVNAAASFTCAASG